VWTRESLLRLGLAFVLSTALWLYVTSKQDPTQAYDYPYALTIAVQNVPGDLTVTNNLPVVHVRIQANRNTTPVTQTSFHPFVDLTNLRRGAHAVPVNVVADPGIQVISVTPSRVQVVLDTQKTNPVAVGLHIFNHPPSGYSTGTYRVDPSTVRVSGPAGAVSQVSKAVVFVSLQGARSDVTGYYPVTLENSQNATISSRLLIAQPSEVHVRVPITPPSTGKTIPVIATVRGQPKAGFGITELTTSPSTVTVFGSPSQQAHLSSVLTAPLLISKRGSGTLSKTVRIQLPNGLYANTYFVTIDAQIQPITGSSSIRTPVLPLNLPPGLAARVVPSDLLVTVLGSAKALKGAANLTATIDLFGLRAGTYQLQPRVNLPAGLQLDNLYPSTLTVTLAPR
jgi:YbbR domain-containing protein